MYASIPRTVLLTAVLLALAACAPRDVAPTASGPPGPRGYGRDLSHVGAATASIEERIWLSDVADPGDPPVTRRSRLLTNRADPIPPRVRRSQPTFKVSADPTHGTRCHVGRPRQRRSRSARHRHPGSVGLKPRASALSLDPRSQRRWRYEIDTARRSPTPGRCLRRNTVDSGPIPSRSATRGLPKRRLRNSQTTNHVRIEPNVR